MTIQFEIKQVSAPKPIPYIYIYISPKKNNTATCHCHLLPGQKGPSPHLEFPFPLKVPSLGKYRWLKHASGCGLLQVSLGAHSSCQVQLPLQGREWGLLPSCTAPRAHQPGLPPLSSAPCTPGMLCSAGERVLRMSLDHMISFSCQPGHLRPWGMTGPSGEGTANRVVFPHTLLLKNAPRKPRVVEVVICALLCCPWHFPTPPPFLADALPLTKRL